MSGGSYDYAYSKLDDLAGRIKSRARGNALRLAFAHKLSKMAEAAKAIEWHDSGDWGEEDELEALRAVLEPVEELNAAIIEARVTLASLHAALQRAQT